MRDWIDFIGDLGEEESFRMERERETAMRGKGERFRVLGVLNEGST